MLVTLHGSVSTLFLGHAFVSLEKKLMNAALSLSVQQIRVKNSLFHEIIPKIKVVENNIKSKTTFHNSIAGQGMQKRQKS